MFATLVKQLLSPFRSRDRITEDIVQLSTDNQNNMMDSNSPAEENVISVVPDVPKKRGRPKKIVEEVKSNSLVVAENGTSPAVRGPAISSEQFYSNDETAVSSTNSSSDKEETEPPVIAKKRGRPPKNGISAQKEKVKNPDAAPSMAKKRGRPKKNAVDIVAEASSPPKKSKPEPTENGTSTTSNNTGDTASPVKRGRGRPKKVQA